MKKAKKSCFCDVSSPQNIVIYKDFNMFVEISYWRNRNDYFPVNIEWKPILTPIWGYKLLFSGTQLL